MTRQAYTQLSDAVQVHILNTPAAVHPPWTYYEQCPSCQWISAYDSNDEAEDLQIVSIGACCGLGSWTCGHCRTTWAPKSSPLNNPLFTHSED